MNTIALKANNTNDVTVISNIFIDHYMPSANGAYVKVYLYLLRCLSNQCINLSLAAIADRLEDTEKDILRAIAYWEKVNLITVIRDDRQQITNITINSLTQQPSDVVDDSSKELASSSELLPSTQEANVEESKSTDAFSSITEEDEYDTPTFNKPTYTQSQIEELSKDNDVRLIMGAVESYMQRPLKPMDQQLILYLYENIGFDADLIMYLYEYCVSNNKKSSNYIEAVALAWHQAGIDTEEKAKQHNLSYNKTFHSISKAFGLNRNPGEAEIKYINKWIKQYSLPIPLITEACNRTLLRVGKPDFNYADKILETWYKKDVKTLEDVKALDAEFMKKNQKNSPSFSAQSVAPSNNRFNNFTQRNYTQEDFQKMEQLLLNKQ